MHKAKTDPPTISSLRQEANQLIQSGRLLRVNQIVGHILPISRSHFLALVKAGKMPQPIKLSERCTCWRAEDIYRVIEQSAG